MSRMFDSYLTKAMPLPTTGQNGRRRARDATKCLQIRHFVMIINELQNIIATKNGYSPTIFHTATDHTPIHPRPPISPLFSHGLTWGNQPLGIYSNKKSSGASLPGGLFSLQSDFPKTNLSYETIALFFSMTTHRFVVMRAVGRIGGAKRCHAFASLSLHLGTTGFAAVQAHFEHLGILLRSKHFLYQ